MQKCAKGYVNEAIRLILTTQNRLQEVPYTQNRNFVKLTMRDGLKVTIRANY